MIQPVRLLLESLLDVLSGALKYRSRRLRLFRTGFAYSPHRFHFLYAVRPSNPILRQRPGTCSPRYVFVCALMLGLASLVPCGYAVLGRGTSGDTFKPCTRARVLVVRPPKRPVQHQVRLRPRTRRARKRRRVVRRRRGGGLGLRRAFLRLAPPPLSPSLTRAHRRRLERVRMTAALCRPGQRAGHVQPRGLTGRSVRSLFSLFRAPRT